MATLPKTPALAMPTGSDKVPNSEPDTGPKLSDGDLRREMGIPDEQTQKVYKENYDKAMQKMANRNTFVKPVDPTTLTPEGKAFREHQAKLSQQPTQLDAILGRLNETVRVQYRPRVIDFATAKKVVMHIYGQDLARKNKGIDFTKEQEEILDNVIRYFINDPDGPYNPFKGLFIYGAYGVGKTWLFRVMSTFCRIVPINEMQFQEVATKTFIETFKDYRDAKDKSKKSNPIIKYSRGDLLLTDLGEEQQIINSYKNEEHPMDLLLSERNIAWDQFGNRTHVTSNLGEGDSDDALSEQIEQIYGTRQLDRFYDQFEFILFPGESKRG